MSDPTAPDDELMRVARAYLARLSSQPPPPNLADDTVKFALSQRRRFSLAGLIGGSAVIVAGATAGVVALAFHNAPVAGPPAGAHIPSVSRVSPNPTPPISPTPTPTPTETTTPTPTNACQPNPDPATVAQVVVSQPDGYTEVTSPLTVSGTINAFEATFQISIKDASGSDLATLTGHSHQGQTLSPFSERVAFTVSTPTPACLWVFQFSAKDGSPRMIQQVPITLTP
jgi:Immunoglobulin-like domain of bacterial spore germination